MKCGQKSYFSTGYTHQYNTAIVRLNKVPTVNVIFTAREVVFFQRTANKNTTDIEGAKKPSTD